MQSKHSSESYTYIIESLLFQLDISSFFVLYFNNTYSFLMMLNILPRHILKWYKLMFGQVISNSYIYLIAFIFRRLSSIIKQFLRYYGRNLSHYHQFSLLHMLFSCDLLICNSKTINKEGLK